MSIKKFFRCTPEQDAVIKTNAANAGMEEASYMRPQAIGRPVMKKIRPIRADWKELQRCIPIYANMKINVFFIYLSTSFAGFF